jgi:hypothetical protein
MTKAQAKKRLAECHSKINLVFAAGYMSTPHFLALLSALEKAQNSNKLN